MTVDDRAIWPILSTASLPAGALAARVAWPELSESLLAASGADRKHHFLLPLQASETLHDETTRGLLVQSKDLVVQGQPAAKFLDLLCVDPGGEEAFDLIGRDIARLLHGGKYSSVEAVSRVLARWRRFWGQVPASRLSRSEIIGLFGEIWFLTNWLVPNFGPIAVDTWRGPAGGRHDFQAAPWSVETKCTTSSRGRLHRIHGLDQLDLPDSGRLYLFSLRLREEPVATNSLPSLVETCTQRLDGDAEAIDLLERALITAGYSLAHGQDYEAIRFRVLEEALFHVHDDFPRLTALDLPQGLPGGVEHLEYDIDLNSFDHLCVAREPQALIPLFQ